MKPLEVWTTLKVLAWTKEFLATRGVENSRLEAEWLLCAATGMDRVGLYLQYDKPLSDSELAAYRSMVARRAKREPLQHILGSQEFCGLDFEVTADVLIPRHDTELLVSQAVSLMPDAKSMLDIGTGSGCIAVSLALHFPAASITAIDISVAALDVARRNIQKHDVAVELLHGSLFEPVIDRSFDLIVSNPPYIPTADIARLEPEVRDFDPFEALNGGADGLDIYRLLIPEAHAHLNTSGWLLLEAGQGQAADVIKIFNYTGGYDEPFTAIDPGGIERVVAGKRKEKQ
ncbi:MAG: protein-(glutamine-N5) methyltransferase, release factor-specific [Geobacteraceae bacterium GWC2_55_20]|nr:MAG: protein-(glutamine-N5) methyltransferase, release factor-specific [Geobacteraceae bacterium GWC2_55_20]OGU24674.1 MAG: protein-(glutamine-N5) methyltransferase, release factor-specific [Geobacteraceae bacterium GWF2_54_21]HBA70919.1 peptide chain release factor N(5)-glutamine methyltransferase [Geobacter sp.]HCE68481.1 peptide chain release factor N(5)-glutamine methyltransferase [Geobacter sp.]